MNLCLLLGQIITIPQYNFFYNSKKHISQIIIKIKTLESNLKKSEIVDLKAYDNIADIICKNYEKGDMISIEGQIVHNLEIEIIKIYQ